MLTCEQECRCNNIIRDMVFSCRNELASAGIPVCSAKNLNVSIQNLNGTRAMCYFDENDDENRNFLICIHRNIFRYFENEKVMKNVKNSIYHELLHTCPDSQTHGDIWQKWSSLCDNIFHTHTKRHIESKLYYHPDKKPSEVYLCPHCGSEYYAASPIANKSCCEICGEEMILV